EANALVSGYLFAKAKGGNVTAQIFWLKTRANWRERALPEHPPADSDPEASSPVVLLLPDNSRDPDLTQALRDTPEKHVPRHPQMLRRGGLARSFATDPGATAPCQPECQFDGPLLAAHDATDHHSRSVLG